MDFKLGNGLFRKSWVAAPSSTKASDGLGPLYNARACQDCHLKDGRGHMPETADQPRVSAFLRLSIPGGTAPEGIEDYLATLASCFRTNVDEVVGCSHYFLVVFHHNHRISKVAQLLQNFNKQMRIARMKSDTWFVENVK